jgi:hypothetical protein
LYNKSMNEKNKNIFLTFIELTRKKLVLARPVAKRSLWFGALLFFVISALILPIWQANAQAWWDVPGHLVNAIISIFLKFLGIILLPGLLLGTLAIGITGLILGWIVSPDFISLRFTQNPFVDIGLSITQDFANMGFIIFLVAIGLATALRIREYQARKTLVTLILIALLINFSPVFCGIIIDAANIVMNYFLTGITGLNSFVDSFVTAGQTAWYAIIRSGLDPWANLSGFMQVLVLIIFNFYAAFIFILFSALFIMRYIMLWILVILSPIAFVSYILPMTRRGRSLLSWKKWWEQLVAWSTIGIIAAFFLYLGFTMIGLIAAAPGGFVSQPDLSWDGKGLGLMNNILPYLIPLVLLFIAYNETKRTSAMFAREIIEMPEKAAKVAAMAATIAATTGVAAVATGKLKGALGTLSSKTKFERWKRTHPTAAALATPIAKPMQWGRRGVEERIAPAVRERVVEPIRDRTTKFVEDHPGLKPYVEEFKGYTEAAGRGLREHLWRKPKETILKGFKEARKDFLKKFKIKGASVKEDKLGDLLHTVEDEERGLTEDEARGFSSLEAMVARGEDDPRVYAEEIRRLRDEMRKEREKGYAAPKREPPKIEEMTAKKFKKEMRPEDLGDINIFYKASPIQIREIERRGSGDQKRALLKLGRTMADEIVEKIEGLVAEGKEKEADNLNEKFKSIGRIKDEEDKKNKYVT